MSRASDIATGIIDARFECLRAGQSSSALYAETSMAIEMAYSLGAIGDVQFRDYRTRFDRFYQAQADAFLADIRRALP